MSKRTPSIRRLSQRERAKLIRGLDDLKRAIRRHPIQVAWMRSADLSLGEYIAAIKRRNEIERILSGNTNDKTEWTRRFKR